MQHNGNLEPALLTRREVELGGARYVEEVWDATHPRCPLTVYATPRPWRWPQRADDVLMITRRIPLESAHR